MNFNIFKKIKYCEVVSKMVFFLKAHGTSYFQQVMPIKMNSQQTATTSAGSKVFVNAVAPSGLVSTIDSDAVKVMLIITGTYMNKYDGENSIDCATATHNQWQYKAGGAGAYADLINTGTGGQMNDEDWRCMVKGGSGSFNMSFDITTAAIADIDANISIQLENARVHQDSMEITLNAFLIILWNK